MNDDTPDVSIKHIGCNHIGSKQPTENEIVEWIVKIGRQCKEKDLDDVLISSLMQSTKKD